MTRDDIMEIAKDAVKGQESRFLFVFSVISIVGTYKGCKVSISAGRGGDISITIKSNQFPKLKWLHLSHTTLPKTKHGAVLTHFGLTQTLEPHMYESITNTKSFESWLDQTINDAIYLNKS